MKVNRLMATRAALDLLKEVGLERLTLRLLGAKLKIQAPTLYWHFKSKEELLDEMATLVLAKSATRLVPRRKSAAWPVWASAFGNGLRKTLLEYRDGARMVSGTRLTDTEYMKAAERVGAKLVASGFTLRAAVVLLSTIYDYTLSLVMEEQSMQPRRGEGGTKYDLAERERRLDAQQLPLLGKAGAILFGNFDRRYKEGLALIVNGAQLRVVKRRPTRRRPARRTKHSSKRRNRRTRRK
jgi:TetR/AcrR family transcriptional regulator, tetracycline repressor protein